MPNLPAWLQTVVFDAVGLSFTGASIYVGIFHGTTDPAFVVFTTMAGAYLGLKASASTTAIAATNAVRAALAVKE